MTRLLNRIALLYVLTLATLLVQAQAPSAGLVAYFPFNGNMNNSGPAAVTATGFNTSFTTDYSNTANKAIQFQGNLNSYIGFTDNGNFDFTGTQNFTATFGFFFNGSTTSGLVDNCLNYGGWGVWFWSTVPGVWNLQFNYKNNSVGSAAATNFTTNAWHHVAAVRNGGTISLYIDGVFRLSAAEGTTAPAYPLNPEAGSMTYGSFSPPRYNAFGGKIDEYRVYNRALTPLEIQNTSDEFFGLGGCTPPTVNPVPNQVVCNNAPTTAINFSGSDPLATYNWTNDNPSIGLAASGTGNIPSFTATNATNSPITANITVTPTSGTCVGTNITTTVTVNPTPVVTNPVVTIGNQGVFFSQTFTQTGGAPVVTFSTASPLPAGLTLSAAGVLSGTPTVTGTFPIVVTVTDGNVCIGTGATYNLLIACSTLPVNMGSSSNAFTNILSRTNAITADQSLNTVLMVHRNNAGAFGGHSGQIRYDISTDGGGTWTNNLGVLNPLSVNGTNGARYPQVALFNPAGNSNPNNAFLSYLAPTVAATFNGLVSGVRKLDGTGNTETYNQPAPSQTLIPGSLVKGAPGVFWAIDAVFNGTATTGFRIYKGVWSGSDVVWSTNQTLNPPFNTAFNGSNQTADFNIAFDPTGQYGWASILTHITGGPAAFAFYPVFYKTVNGGNTWSGPYQVDLGQFSCISANITPGNVASTAFESDLVVDINGDPHLLTTVCNGNNAYAVFFGSWHHMFDITSHGGVWNAVDVSNVNAGRGTYGTNPNAANLDQAPMMSRSVDGKKVFFAWADNSAYAIGQANLTPNLFSKAYDVVDKKWTAARDFTSCDPSTNGQVRFPKMATEVLEPVAGEYKLAAAITQMGLNDPINTANFQFLNNIKWNDIDFTVNQPTASVSINEGATLTICEGIPSTLSITGAYDQVLWSNGATTNSTTVSTSGTYVVTVRVGCTLGSDTIVVTANPLPTVNAVTDQAVCNGSLTTAVNFSGTPAGVVFNWTNNTPGIGLAASGTGNIASFTATNATSAPVTATITVTPSYTSGITCTGTPITFTITVNPTATVDPVANQTVCNNSPTAAVNFTSPTTGGTIVYNWTNNTPSIGLTASGTGNIASFTATNATNAPVTATITVTPTYTNGVSCVGTPITFTITVNPTPDVAQPANQVVCNNGATLPVNFTGSVSGTVFNWTNSDPTIGLGASARAILPALQQPMQPMHR
ncbi:MAG: hypothetical protein IPP31_01175 [Chitinophagaceae bacterium]|nr:hypothetical protein [Chitinophagaceae bacterium]